MQRAGRRSNWSGGRCNASGAESRRLAELQVLEAAGDIIGLEFQKRYELRVNGIHIANYHADFVYQRKVIDKRTGDATWVLVVEDAKGRGNSLTDGGWHMKIRLMRACFDIRVVVNNS